MEQSSKNENICDVFINEVRIEDEILPKLEEMRSFRIEGSRNPKMNEIIKKNYMHKEHFGEEIIEMRCVGHFIVLMITKKLM
jgi:hypothetical protein